MITEKFYAITFTLSSKMYEFNEQLQYAKTHKIILETLKPFIKNSTMIAELTKKRNIHYHGLVKLTSSEEIHLYRRIMGMINGNKSIGKIFDYAECNDLQKWIDYINKDKYEILIDELKVIKEGEKEEVIKMGGAVLGMSSIPKAPPHPKESTNLSTNDLDKIIL